MRKDWSRQKVEKLCEQGGSVQTGPFGSQLHSDDYIENGVPVVMPQNIEDGRITTDDIAQIGDDDWKRLSKYHLEPGDIVFARRGDLSRITIIDSEQEGWVCGTGCIRVRFNGAPIDDQYAYYFLSRDQTEEILLSKAVGSTMPNLNTDIIRSLQITTPPLPTQRRIAEILSALDDKIELNRQMNQTLEAMAQALYRHWFVDFGPFQDREFKETEELGPIPKRWNPRALDSFFSVKTGKKNASAAVEDGDYPFFTCAQSVSRIDEWVYDEDSILLAGNGNFNVKWYRGKFDAYQRTYILTPENPKLLGVLYFAMKHHLDDLTIGHQGTVIQYLTKSMIADYVVSWPPEEVLERIIPKFQSIISMVEHNREESRTLAETRDYLLPKLISGEIEVSPEPAESPL